MPKIPRRFCFAPSGRMFSYPATQGVALGYYVSCAFSAQKAMRKAAERSYAKSPRIKISQPPSNPVTEIS
jgi:hypothetical protein